MTSNDYLKVYANDQEVRYHHIPPLDIAIRISCILLSKLLTLIQQQERFEIIVH